jgi:pyruvate dehydrogenase E1 component alpha subunit
MVLARHFDERRLRLQRQGSIGTFAPVKGQEAANLGPVSALEKRDWFVPSFREPAAAVYRGTSLEHILAFDAGFNEAAKVPGDAHDLPNCVPVATQLPHAVGIGHAARLRKTGEVAMTFFGDGATSEGDFHEALNFAATWKAPVVFVCQNNQWAISVPRERQTASKTLAQKAIAYGMPGVQVDGNDLFACHLAAKRACDRARAGEGPTLIECVTYRLSMHTTADDPKRYRDASEVEAWEAKDPLPRLRKFLIGRQVLSEQEVSDLEARVDERIADAWNAAKRTMREWGQHPERMFDHLYEQVPPYLDKQRVAFMEDRERHRDGNGKKNGGER